MRRNTPDPSEQELPQFPPDPTVGVEQWLVESVHIGNVDIDLLDYCVRDGVLTSERRPRSLTEQEVNTLYRSGAEKTFTEWMDHISGLAE